MRHRRSMTVLILVLGALALHAGPPGAMDRVEALAAMGERADDASIAVAAEAIQGEPAAVTTAVLARMQATGTGDEARLATYAWALGVARDARAREPLIALYTSTTSDLVRGNALRAIALVGGKESEDFLVSVAGSAPSNEQRFGALDLLAESGSPRALSLATPLLKDRDGDRRQAAFLFGKLGADAVPFLVERLADPDRDVREHAAMLLGNWLSARQAGRPLVDRYPREPDPGVRKAILEALPSTAPDVATLEGWCKTLAGQEKDPGIRKGALALPDAVKAEVSAFVMRKKVSADTFRAEYERLFGSLGAQGDLQVLAASSARSDEARLEVLRRHLLRRNSEQALSDHDAITRMLVLNRLM